MTLRLFFVDALLILAIMIAIYLLLSLISFSPADPGWSQTAWHEPIHNWGGDVGAYLSDILLQFLGYVAYLIPLLIIVLTFQARKNIYLGFKQPINYFSISFRTIGIMAFIFCTAGYLSLNIEDLAQIQAGGIIGDIVAQEILGITNHLCATLLLLTISLASITLLTDLSWLNIAEKIGASVVFITTPLFAFIGRAFKSPAPTISRKKNFKRPNLDRELKQETIFDRSSLTVDEQMADQIPDKIDELKSSEVMVSDSTMIAQETTEVVDYAPSEPEIEQQTIAPQDHHDHYMALIDENNPPRRLSIVDDFNKPNEFSINPDYYSPIATSALSQQAEQVSASVPNVISELVALDATDKSSMVQNALLDSSETSQLMSETEPVVVSEDKILANPNTNNFPNDLIHPLLQKNSKPLIKPTTPLPSLELLTAPPTKQIEIDHNALQKTAALLEKSLADFRVKARVVAYLPGPVITRFEIELAPGVKASRISTLDRDLARSLSMSSVRVVEVIPGKPYVGIELPNQHRQTVYFREVLDSPQFKDAQSPLTVVLGKDIAGQSVVADLAKMPHLLVAGTTGSGKSVGVNAMILSILYKSQPEDAKFIMIDPKMLELSVYQGIPHLLTDVVTDMKDAANALNWCVNEMEKRYRLMSALGVRNIAGYNDKIKQAEAMGRPIPDPLWKPTDSMDINMPTLAKLPYIVVMVDEFADLIMAVGKKVEELIARLAQKARAAGIHLVLATQRPSVDVITGLIKANIPTRIAFTVSSKIDSRTILDQMGAESLLGMGDMLYLAPNSSIPIRVHGAFVRDEEVHSVVQDWKARGIPTQYIDNITSASNDSEANGFDNTDEELDPLFDQVVEFVIDKRRASISSVQRQFRIGYNRAARIVEQMELQGIVSPPTHNGNREVLAQSINFD